MPEKFLEKALGDQKAIEIINRLQGALQMTPFDFCQTYRSTAVAELHPK